MASLVTNVWIKVGWCPIRWLTHTSSVYKLNSWLLVKHFLNALDLCQPPWAPSLSDDVIFQCKRFSLLSFQEQDLSFMDKIFFLCVCLTWYELQVARIYLFIDVDAVRCERVYCCRIRMCEQRYLRQSCWFHNQVQHSQENLFPSWTIHIH